MKKLLISGIFAIYFILGCYSMSFSQNQSNPTAISSNIVNQVTMQVTNQYIGNNYTQNASYPKCLTDEVTAGFVQQQILIDPSYLSKVAAQTQLIQQGAQNNSASKKVLRTIPVVVHILYNSGNSNSPDENVPDSYIYDMLNTLNEDYRRLNADASQTRSQFQGVAADVEIEFCLASKDANGASTTGITRTATTEGYFNPDTETNKMKSNGTNGKTGWDATKYLNIWICNISNYANYGTAGYAYLPTSGMHGSSIDGLVIDFKLGIYYGDGRTATHEIGHYMGLQHTWGSNPPSCSNDDGFSDTPTNSSENYGCNYSSNSCSGGDVDQIENYMSYSDCQNMFSLEQAAYMNSVLTNTRSSLLSSTGCEPTASPVVDFTSNKTTVQAGGTVLFTDLSTGIPTGWSWNFGGGGTPNTSTDKNPAIQFNTIGTYTVSLTAINSLGSDSETKTSYITVTAPSGCDTINWAFLLNTSLYTYTCGPTCGYVIGSNEYDDQAKAQKFSVSEYAPNTHVTGGMFYFGNAYKASGSNALVIFKVWDSDGTAGAPGTVLGADTVDLADIVSDVQGNYLTQILFNSPVNVTSDFYFGFEMLNFDLWTGGTRDSLSLVQTLDGVMAGSNVWEYADRGSGYDWYDFSSIWSMTTTMFATPYMTDQPPAASFTASPTSGCDGLTVNFDASASTNVLGYLWDFDGDGFYDELDTIDGQISYVYDTTGTFDVTLLGIGACSGLSKSTQSNLITINAKPTLSASATNTSCVSCNGTATVNASGASTPYTYQWNDPSSGVTSSVASLCAGSFQVTVTDANGCTEIAGVNISDGASMSISTSSTNANCGNATGTATANPTGGTGAYTYLWDDPGMQTNQVAIGLNSGTYNVTIEDANGCTIETDFFSAAVVNSTAEVYASIPSSSNPSSCGSSDGTATASASGGTSPYSYNWSNSSTSAAITGLAGGTYIVTITDANSCTDTASVTLTVPSAPNVSASGTDPTGCGTTDGTATASASGGTSPYFYNWSNSASTSTITGLSAGTYTVTITDANSCTANASVTLTASSAPSVTTAGTDPTCNGDTDGTATATGSGGTGSFTYSWNTTPAQSNATATGLSGGILYTVTITDGIGCNNTSSITLIDPAAIVLSTSSTNASCGNSDGDVSVTVSSGGTAPFSYLWDDPGAQTTSTANNLTAGSFNVIVTDANGCLQNSSANVSNTGAPTANITESTLSCNGDNDGTATINATGGAAPYTYEWSTSPVQTNAMATGLSGGSYTATITDAVGCITVANATVNEPAALTISTNTTIASQGLCDGTATATPGGGTGAYTYLWNDSLAQTTATATGLCIGLYTVLVTDSNGCSTSTLVTIADFTGVQEINNHLTYNIYPNPTSGDVFVELHLENYSNVEIRIFNTIGELLSSDELINIYDYKYIMNCSEFAGGIYYIHLQTEDEAFVNKISILK